MSAREGWVDRFQWFLSGERPAAPEELDARLGAIAVQEGYLSQERLEECRRDAGGRPFLDVAREKGLLTEDQVQAIRDIERIGSAEAAAGPARTLPGRGRIGRFRLLEILGEGGMGVVFRAHDEQLGRDVALKMLKTVQAYSTAQVERFQREARNAGRLRHPGIVTIYEVGREEDALYYTMELVDGRPFTEVRGELDQRIRILEKAARAVHYAHEQGVVHRDLKPPNVLVDARGTPRILDFGLSRDLQSTSDLSRTGALLGTPYYMSPEQAEGRVHELDGRTDVYALGVMLYEVLEGRVPFEGDTLTEVVRRSTHDDPRRPQGPAPLVAVCLKALEKDPARRYSTAAAFADDLARYLKGQPVRARREGSWRRLLRRGRNRAVLAAAGAAASLLAAWLLWGGSAENPAPAPAPDRWKDALILLRRVDPAKDTITGAWKLERGELHSDRSKRARIEIPYMVPREYDVRVTFTNRDRDGTVAVILSWGARSFAFVMDPRGTAPAGFEILGLSGGWKEPPPADAAGLLVPDRRHTLVAEVRESEVSVALDGRRLCAYRIKDDTGRLSGMWTLKDKRVVGLGTSDGVTVFHAVELLELKGTGVPSR